MKQGWRYLGQGLTYVLFIAFIGYFSTAPSYTHVPPDKVLIKLAFTHAGKRVKPFDDKRTKEDLAKLPPQLRYKKRSRERSPLLIEIKVDGHILYEEEIAPKGLSRDLPSPVYKRFIIPPGRHHILVRMRDDVHAEGFTFIGEKVVNLAPLQTLVIDFDNIRGEFIFE